MHKFKLDSLLSFKSRGLDFKIALWLAVVCGSLLFLPESILSILRLDSFVSENAHFIGLGLIVGVAYQISRVLNCALDAGIAHLTEKKLLEKIEGKINLLDPSERALLREFFLQGTSRLTLPQDEPAVKALVGACVLESLGNERHYAIQGPTADYKISMAAREHLNRRVLRLPPGEPSKEELQQLIRNRPTFIGGVTPVRKQAA